MGTMAARRFEARTAFGRPRCTGGSATAAEDAPFAARLRATLRAEPADLAPAFFAVAFLAVAFFALLFFAGVTELFASRFECQTRFLPLPAAISSIVRPVAT